MWDKKSERLLDVKEMDEFDEDEIPLRTSLLNAYVSTLTSTSLSLSFFSLFWEYS